MNNKNLRIGVLAAAIFLASPLIADDGLSFYVGAGAGRSDMDGEIDQFVKNMAGRGHTITAVSEDDDSTTFKVFGGLRFMPRGSAEFGYMKPGTTGLTVQGVPAGGDTQAFFTDLANLQPLAPEGFFADVVGRYPLGERVHIFGRLGAFIWESDVEYNVGGTIIRNDRSDTSAHFGMGFEFTGDEKLKVRVEWERFDSDTKLDFLSVSAYFEF